MSKVGFVGVGVMGLPMARNLIDTPGAQMSSCGLVEGGSVGPGGVFVIGGSVFEAAVEDAHESVGEGS